MSMGDKKREWLILLVRNNIKLNHFECQKNLYKVSLHYRGSIDQLGQNELGLADII